MGIDMNNGMETVSICDLWELPGRGLHNYRYHVGVYLRNPMPYFIQAI